METTLTHAIDGFEIPVTDMARASSSTKRDPAPRKALSDLSRDLLTLRPFLGWPDRLSGEIALL